MKKTKSMKLLSLILAMMMVMSLFSVTGMTAYAADAYSISISSAEHGSISAHVNGAVTNSAEVGSTVTLVASPETSYKLKDIQATYTVNNETITYNNTDSSHFSITSNGDASSDDPQSASRSRSTNDIQTAAI